MNIPNSLTLLRIVLIPVFVLVFFLPFSWSFFASSVIFVLASVTDWLDGYLARRLDQTTPFGAFLDPVADKLMVVIALVLLVNLHDSIWFTLAALIIIGREIVISALREWMADIGKRTSVAVSFIGKIKTTVQMLAIIVLLAVDPFKGGGEYSIGLVAGYILLYTSALLTLYSMIVYLRIAWPDLTAAAGTGTAGDAEDNKR